MNQQQQQQKQAKVNPSSPDGRGSNGPELVRPRVKQEVEIEEESEENDEDFPLMEKTSGLLTTLHKVEFGFSPGELLEELVLLEGEDNENKDTMTYAAQCLAFFTYHGGKKEDVSKTGDCRRSLCSMGYTRTLHYLSSMSEKDNNRAQKALEQSKRIVLKTRGRANWEHFTYLSDLDLNLFEFS